MIAPLYTTVSAAVDLEGPLRAFLRAASKDPALTASPLLHWSRSMANVIPYIIDGGAK